MSAAEVVSRQVEAYNARDLDRFLACYSPGVVIRSGDGTVLMQGHDAMREAYGERFAQGGLHAEILNRVELGSWVVDEEHVTAEDLDLRAVVAYEVGDALIERVVMITDQPRG
jgi:hypothetical protein